MSDPRIYEVELEAMERPAAELAFAGGDAVHVRLPLHRVGASSTRFSPFAITRP